RTVGRRLGGAVNDGRGRGASVAAVAMLAVTTAPAAATPSAATVIAVRRQARRVGLDMEPPGVWNVRVGPGRTGPAVHSRIEGFRCPPKRANNSRAHNDIYYASVMPRSSLKSPDRAHRPQ